MRLKYIFMIIGMLVFVGCGGGSGTAIASAENNETADTPIENNDTTLPAGVDYSALQAIPVGESRLLTIPTYDGSNQVVHPDIITHNGLFYMTITPYPWSNVEHENPSFYVSGDGLSFAPVGHNPLINHPKNGYNDDPDLIVDPRTGLYYIYYNETPRDHDIQYLDLLQSADGVNWTHRRLTEFRTNKHEPFIVSPAIVINNGVYDMFHVEIDTKNEHSPNTCSDDPYKHQIRVMQSSDGVTWDKNQDVGIATDMPADFNPWHLNIIPGNGHYYMLVNGYRSGFCDQHNLYLAVSDDLAHWHFVAQPIVTADKNFFDSKIIYRSAAVVNGDDMYVYFSFYRYDKRWMLGVKHISLSATVR